MPSEKMQQKLIEQVGKEWDSEYYYLGMSAWCYNNELDGFGAWFEQQAGEEHLHGLRILHYLRDVGGTLVIPAVQPPPAEFKNLVDVFEKTLAHEQKVTSLIHSLLKLAREESDYTTEHALQWFVNEQIEEENTARGILARVKRAGDNPSALLMLEEQLGGRAPEGGGAEKE